MSQIDNNTVARVKDIYTLVEELHASHLAECEACQKNPLLSNVKTLGGYIADKEGIDFRAADDETIGEGMSLAALREVVKNVYIMPERDQVHHRAWAREVISQALQFSFLQPEFQRKLHQEIPESESEEVRDKFIQVLRKLGLSDEQIPLQIKNGPLGYAANMDTKD